MKYLERFRLLDDKVELDVKLHNKSNLGSYYPFDIFTNKHFLNIDFEDVTIFYGGNGSGKSTILNIISDKIGASRKELLNLGDLFSLYVNLCKNSYINRSIIKEIKYISSDDVFDYLLDTRAINNKVNRRKNEIGDEYLSRKYERTNDIIDVFKEYDRLKDELDASRSSKSEYRRSRLTNNTLITMSNGETALSFWEREIGSDSIYILDEPENSLSAENQLKLRDFIYESARFYNCQFIISTHSPFLLSIPEALIYDLDSNPVITKKWTELDNVKVYYNFFKDKDDEFTL